MGLLEKIFHKEKSFPELDASSRTAGQIDSIRQDLENLAKEMQDSMEVVPTDDIAFVFIGKPPKKFDMAWIKDWKITNLKTWVQEHSIPEMKVQVMLKKITEAYEKNKTAERFTATIAGRHVIVTESPSLAQELGEIIH